MAAPVIQSITVTPDPVPVGQQATVTVAAFDPDASVVSVDVDVTDSQGNTQSGASTFAISDPLTYLITVDQGTVTQDPTDPSVWVWSP